MSEKVDLAILGAGPGGYVAAVRAAQLGMKVAIVEKEQVGGVCLHKGCIPSKSLLRSAEVYHMMKNSQAYGICAVDVTPNLQLMQQRKQQMVAQLHQRVEGLLQKNKVAIYAGTGRILGPSIFSPLPGTISVEKQDGSEAEVLVPQFVLIATGSRPRTLPGLAIDGRAVIDSDHALQMENLPQSIAIIGGGVIGIEWASLLSDLEVEVTVIESAARILPLEEEEISQEMTRILKERKVKIWTNTNIDPDRVTIQDQQVVLSVERGSDTISLTVQQVLVAVGRVANVEDIGLHNTAIQVEKGVIAVNPFMQTAESHMYAIGDVTGGYQFAHVASHEGILAVEHMNGLAVQPIDPLHIPRCLYSRPEVGSIGLTEAEAKKKGYSVKVGKFPFRGVGKSWILGESEGFIKMISDRATDDLLGVHILGADATHLISEAGLAKVLNATAWEITKTIHPHPTLAEVYGEVALAVDGKAIHA
jgi:dihydrolipoamide dehydrogenase